MKYEKSCGTVIFNKDKVLLVKHNIGHWSFPKGHVEENETEQQTALRETEEETGLEVEIVSNKRYILTYEPEEGISKEVIYFIAKTKKGKIKAQPEEIAIVEWVNLCEAESKITHESDKELYKEILKDYKNLI